MKKITSILRLLLLVTTLACYLQGNAKKIDIYELSLDQNLATPEIKNKLKDAVQDFQYKQAVELIKQNYEVELTRDNEVIIVTIPAERLFASNDTVLAATGPAALKPMLRYLKNPGFYKLLLVMHSDDTGSKAYTVRLTRSRVNAVYDWFDANGDVDYIVPYALGSNDPLNANDSMEKRRKNRRLEIYIVPNDVMLEQAKRGAININIIKKK
ncbi:OmpA family protein [Sodaliphilus pleomorphus]|jgi:outer membrane protein OmpA-like peptidoglycan-associated protein|uniref:OmpA family protein n=1 Tax=Sodaliphilus pleomorphus TaxID=2606626 RepID=A0A6L5XD47_9BACT|nr:OmpA family protein [Sodaliphilus pleomorphus]MCI5980194.1 OmpA family protein [Muribaculaceae bacterium]MDY6252493.1 OmpA family protein [Bacteroidales bacterium]MCI6169447.1 OmpA family protein [Muribaculaceae bacterium]MDD6474658.1 OmpA family protein [Sodaliphilus pleomorphus]MDY6259317.1 OmpA family protein [Bacteroidales bacterium]